MTEEKKYQAALARKGLDATGVDEQWASKMAAHLGGSTMLIVEARHHQVTTNDDGTVKVTLQATQVHPVPAELDDRVREFARALYRERPGVAGQEVLKGIAAGPSSAQAAEQLDPRVWDGDLDAPLTPDDPDGDGDDDPGEINPEDTPAGGSVTAPDFSSGRKRGKRA